MSTEAQACKRCGAKVAPGAAFCAQCGQQAPSASGSAFTKSLLWTGAALGAIEVLVIIVGVGVLVDEGSLNVVLIGGLAAMLIALGVAVVLALRSERPYAALGGILAGLVVAVGLPVLFVVGCFAAIASLYS